MILTRAIGIDLGTTNSAVAILAANEHDLILCKDEQGRAVTPSVVWRDARTGDVLVGHRAFARKGTIPEPISSIKRHMGTQMTVKLGTSRHSPAEISSFILREMKRQMEAEMAARPMEGAQFEIDRAIVTVPAYFDITQIEATREAGRLAGLEVTELLHEPTAAAIYYAWKHDLGDGTYMVYDLGGGTFDVSILRRTSGEFLVLGIAGDTFLGGDDFDRRLAEYLRKQLAGEGYELDLDLQSDPEDRLRFNQLVAVAERAKIELSSREEFLLRDQGALRDKSNAPVVIETTLTRATFAELIGDLLDKTIARCREALEKSANKAGVGLEQVDHILLVGGSTYVPAVMERVREAFCSGTGPRALCAAPIRDDPETAVALGAALRAASAGLGVGDDDRRVRVWFRGSGSTKRTQTTLAGHVDVLDKMIDLSGAVMRLITHSGETLAEAPLGEGLSFAFAKVQLLGESLNAFRLEILDSERRLVAAVDRSIVHAANQKEAVGRTLSTAVLPRPILLEATDGDRLLRQVLLAEGTSLPATARFTFALSDPAGRLRLPIYQENRVIKELKALVTGVPVGTPVDVEISCDEQVRLRVRFSVADQEFGGQIEPPPPDNVPTEFELNKIEAEFASAMKRLEPADRERLEQAYKQQRSELDEAKGGADYPKVIQRAADLSGLIRDARLAEPLDPRLEEVEESYESCQQLMEEAMKIAKDFVPATLKGDLDNAMVMAREAYGERDRAAYSNACQAIAMARQFLGSISRARMEGQDVDISVRVVMALDQAREVTQGLLVHCLMSNQSRFIPPLTQQLKEVSDLESQRGADPVAVYNRCRVLITEAQRIYEQITPQKQDPDFKGLLKVGAAAGRAALGTGGSFKVEQ